MARFRVHSRGGNVALAVLGVLYALSSLVVLAWFVVDVHQTAAVAVELLLQLGLVGSSVCGIWFLAIAWDNLGIGERQHRART